MLSEDQMFYELGLELLTQGRENEARAALEEARRLAPSRADAALELARLACRRHDLRGAHQMLSQTLQHHPEAAEVHLELGQLFHTAGQFEHALQYYRSALRLQPALSQAWIQLARLLQELNQGDAAEEVYRAALAQAPTSAEAWNGLGLLQYFRQDTQHARISLAKAVGYAPENADYQLNLGMSWLQEPADLQMALQILSEAMRLNPAYSEEVVKMGDHFCQRHDYERASLFFSRARHYVAAPYVLELKLAHCWEQECRMQEALDHYQRALELKPDQWLIEVRAALMLPLVYHNREEIILWRERFARNLQTLLDTPAHKRPPRAEQVLPFYAPAFRLAYQGFDNRRLLEALGQLWQKALFLPQTSRQQLRAGPRRIGVLSAYLFQHSFNSLFLELLRQLAARGHQLYAYSVGHLKQDAVSVEIQSLAQWRTLETERPLQALADTVLQDDLDLLLFPEVGIDPMTYFLASTRLAPQQILLSGHPSTSGLNTLDYFVSSRQVETDAAQADYSERLLSLSRLPACTQRPRRPLPLRSREDLGLPPGHLYLVPGELSKIHPDHDPIFAALLERDPQAQLLLIQPTHPGWHRQLYRRFADTLSPWLERIHFLPQLEKTDLHSLLLAADAVLDTLHFGGGSLAYQALGLGVPLLTLPGQFLRSRSTAAMYRQLGLTDCIADTPETLIALCLRMAQDPEWKTHLQRELLARADRLFEDRAVMGELADFLEGLTLT